MSGFMKRDMNLVRKILLQIEDKYDGSMMPIDISIDGHEAAVVVEHLHLLHEAGFLQGIPADDIGGHREYTVFRLNWEGHDFLDSIRDEGVWRVVAQKLSSVSGSTSLAVVKELAIHLTKQQLGLS